MDLHPDKGTYRMSVGVAGVEANALRATLGVRPIPLPVAGGLRGTLHVTGPLDKPVFSGARFLCTFSRFSFGGCWGVMKQGSRVAAPLRAPLRAHLASACGTFPLTA
jgi:hypothetical protein